MHRHHERGEGRRAQIKPVYRPSRTSTVSPISTLRLQRAYLVGPTDGRTYTARVLEKKEHSIVFTYAHTSPPAIIAAAAGPWSTIRTQGRSTRFTPPPLYQQGMDRQEDGATIACYCCCCCTPCRKQNRVKAWQAYQ